MSHRMPSPVVSPELSINKRILKIVSILRRNKFSEPQNHPTPLPISPEAALVVERAKGIALEEISPLGALQLIIERINLESKDEERFKNALAKQLFSDGGRKSNQRVEVLWNLSAERKAIYEIYSLISISREVRRPITFRDAFNRVYESKGKVERGALNRIAKALIIYR